MKVRIPAQTVEIETKHLKHIKAMGLAWAFDTRLFECNHCGEVFEAHRSDAMYCSGACKVAAHRSKKT